MVVMEETQRGSQNNHTEVLLLIPARGGSKSIPRKNILPFAGHPLIAYSIAAGLAVETVCRVIVSTDDEQIAERSRSLRNLCFQCDRRFVHEQLGWNYRMTNIQAALGVAQLEKIDDFAVRKRQIGQRYTRLLSDFESVKIPIEKTDYAQNIYWVYGVVLSDNVLFDAAEAMAKLRDRNIGTRPFFWPMHEQPVFNKMGLFKNETHPVAQRIARRGFYIPSGLTLTDEAIEYVAGSLKDVLR